jgi:hypothetical protein
VRILTLPVSVLLVIGLGAAVAAQKPYPIFTSENFINNMQLLGRNFGAVNASLAKNDFENAKAQLARSRELLAITITFWRDRKKDDAVKILRDTLARMDDLDIALSADKIDPVAATALAKQIDAKCESCHSIYREQDPETKGYRFKKGSVQ